MRAVALDVAEEGGCCEHWGTRFNGRGDLDGVYHFSRDAQTGSFGAGGRDKHISGILNFSKTEKIHSRSLVFLSIGELSRGGLQSVEDAVLASRQQSQKTWGIMTEEPIYKNKMTYKFKRTVVLNQVQKHFTSLLQVTKHDLKSRIVQLQSDAWLQLVPRASLRRHSSCTLGRYVIPRKRLKLYKVDFLQAKK
eukprot:scaffold2267_cov187-Ochromonas_danica.AAC.7